MSFILDALKKSETERQQGGSGEFSSVPMSRGTKATPRWLWLLGALLAINLAVLLGLFLRGGQSPVASDVAEETQAATSPPEAPVASDNFAERVANAREQAPPQQTESDESEQTTAIQAMLVAAEPTKVDTEDVYPTIHAMRANGVINLPDLHLDIHVFSEKPADRFVFVNMSKYREGAQLAEGPVVAEITPDGVVLGHRGHYFILPRE